MIVISNPTLIKNEISTINLLFENGMELFHIRKPDFSVAEMKAFLFEIKSDYRQNLVLHSHHQLAVEFGIHRIHFTEKKRNETSEESLKKWKENRFTLSTSIHKWLILKNYQLFSIMRFLGPFSKVFPKQITCRILILKKN